MKYMVIRKSEAKYQPDTFEEINVQDGMWVLQEVESAACGVREHHRRCELIGVSLEKVARHLTSYEAHVNYGSGYNVSETSLFIASEPFGAIIRSTGYHGHELHKFVPAQEISNGKLGHEPPVKMPQFIHEGTLTPQHRIWANLAETAQLAGFDPLEFLQRYYLFDNFDDLLWFAVGENPGPIFKLDRKPPAAYPRVKMPRGLAAYATDSADVPHVEANRLWITGGLATSAVYLRYFNYVPPLPA